MAHVIFKRMKLLPSTLIVSLLVLNVGCQPVPGFHSFQLPQESMQPQDLAPSPQGLEPESLPEENMDVESDLSGNPGDQRTQTTMGDSMLEIARWVISNESRKVGRACNFFVQRVLYHMGFGPSSWRANDFDRYVRSNFQSVKKVSFRYDPNGVGKARLKRYLLSFPEEEGVILQWKRKQGSGHVAIVQRYQNSFIIYHASLNRFYAKSQWASVDSLLYRSRIDYTLTVFSNFEK